MTKKKLQETTDKKQDSQDSLKIKAEKNHLPHSQDETLRLINELKVHQLELEAQNEELQITRAAAQEAEKKYSELYNFAPSGYFTISPNGEIMEANKSGSVMLGREPFQLKNSKFIFFVSDDTKSIFNQFLSSIFLNKSRVTCELTLSADADSHKHIRLSGIISENGKQCLVIVSDVSTHIHDEESIKLSETRYRRLFESAKDGILILNAETGMIMDVNPYLIEMLGYSKDSFIEKQIWQIGLFKDIAANKEKFLELQQKKIVRYDDLPLETAEGKQVNVEFVSNVYLEGKIKVIQCNIRNITARKEAEKALIKNEEKFRFISENISDLVWIYNFKNEWFTYISPSIVQLLGYTESEVLDEGIENVLSFDSYQKLIELLPVRLSLFLNGIHKTYTDELQFICKDKSIKWIETVTRYHYTKNHVAEVLGVSRDISRRKLLEEEIRLMNADLRKINDEKDKFFSIIAHDLRNPFSGFLGLTELMAEGLTTMSIDEIQKTAVLMRNSATSLFRLLSNLLEWSSMQRGLNLFVPEQFLLMPKVTETMVLILDSANKKGIRINYHIPGDMMVYADKNMLEGIIRNLVTNAVKFTRAGGNITISANTLPDHTSIISIKDSGIGMNKTMLDNLFRLDINTNRKGTEGEYTTGLGLIICKDFIGKHGGKLWVESEEEVGSIFHFSLPANHDL